MDDMEFLKKLFLEKEKENMKLKQEIEQIKTILSHLVKLMNMMIRVITRS